MTRAVHDHVHVNVYVHVNVNVDVDVNVIGFFLLVAAMPHQVNPCVRCSLDTMLSYFGVK